MRFIKLSQKETCECIGKKNYDYTKADRADVEMSLGLCMLESAQKNNLPIDIADTGSMTALGEKVGVLMVGVCPDVFKVFIDKKEPERSRRGMKRNTLRLQERLSQLRKKTFSMSTLKMKLAKSTGLSGYIIFRDQTISKLIRKNSSAKK
jgi:hypothetical protein